MKQGGKTQYLRYKILEGVHRQTQRIIEKFTIFQVTYCHSRTDGPRLGVTSKR